MGYKSEIKRDINIEEELNTILKNDKILHGACPTGINGPKTNLVYLIEEKKVYLFMDYEDTLMKEVPEGDKNNIFIIDFNDGAPKKHDINSMEDIEEKFVALFHITNDYLGYTDCKFKLTNLFKINY